MRRALAFAALAALAAAPARAAHWTVDSAKSRLAFSVTWAGRPFDAVFKSWKADIAFDPADLAHSHVVATIDLASEDSGSPDNDDGLKGAEGFAVDKFPTARFETTGFTHTGGDRYLARARLSLHGVTRPVQLPFILTFSGNTARMTGKTVLMRTDFGIGHGEWAKPAPVAHEVTVTVDLTATKGP